MNVQWYRQSYEVEWLGKVGDDVQQDQKETVLQCERRIFRTESMSGHLAGPYLASYRTRSESSAICLKNQRHTAGSNGQGQASVDLCRRIGLLPFAATIHLLSAWSLSLLPLASMACRKDRACHSDGALYLCEKCAGRMPIGSEK